LYSDHGPR